MTRERVLWLLLAAAFAAAGYFLTPENEIAPTILYICAGVYLRAAAFGNPKDPE